MHITRELLRNYLQDNFGLEIHDIDDSTKLFSGGLLDSFSVADLLLFIEEKGNIVVEPEEITYDNLDTISYILAYAKGKRESLSA